MEESIIGRLKDDHKQINFLLEEIESSTTLKDRRKKFEQLKALMIPLLKAVDEAILTRLDDPDHKITQLCFHQHHDIRDILQRLTLLNSFDTQWMSVFHNFHLLTQKHSAEEERVLFPEIKEDFSREELIEIGYDFEDAKTHG